MCHKTLVKLFQIFTTDLSLYLDNKSDNNGKSVGSFFDKVTPKQSIYSLEQIYKFNYIHTDLLYTKICLGKLFIVFIMLQILMHIILFSIQLHQRSVECLATNS